MRHGEEYHSGIWVVPVGVEAAGPTRVTGGDDGIRETAVTSDGSSIAYVSGSGREVWMIGADGEHRRKILAGGDGDIFSCLSWLGGGQWLVLTRLQLVGSGFNINIESHNPATRQNGIILTSPWLRGSCASPSGRLIYSLADKPPHQNDTSFWEVRIDPQTGKRLGDPRQITRSNGANTYSLSVTSDGNRLAFLKGPYQAAVYVADLAGQGTRLLNPRRLTLDDSNNLPTAWAPDSRAVLFHSDRNGTWEIFRQSLNRRTAERIVTGPEDCRAPRVSPDGAWILYFARRNRWLWTKFGPQRLMRVSLNGGPPEVVYKRVTPFSVHCARPPSNRCVLGERRLGRLIFYDLDPVRGKGAELTRTDVIIPIGHDYWDVSPDGSRIAVALGGSYDGLIRVFNVDGTKYDVRVEGRGGFQSMDWAVDGRGWYISSRSGQTSELLYVDLEGRARLLWQSPAGFETWGIPSPDGRHLAFLEWTSASNIWMIEDF